MRLLARNWVTVKLLFVFTWWRMRDGMTTAGSKGQASCCASGLEHRPPFAALAHRRYQEIDICFTIGFLSLHHNT
jgi:hypothetical protein